MSNQVFWVRNAEYFGIDAAIFVFQSDGVGLGRVGLNASEIGKSLLSDILQNSFVINDRAAVIDLDNVKRALNGAYADKCSLFLHSNLDALKKYETEYKKYSLDMKKYAIKSRANKECSLPEKSKVVDLIISAGESLDENIKKACDLDVDYLTLWPKYWDGYGEHFYIYSESEHALNVAIERIKALCDAKSVMFNELDSLELLPVE